MCGPGRRRVPDTARHPAGGDRDHRRPAPPGGSARPHRAVRLPGARRGCARPRRRRATPLKASSAVSMPGRANRPRPVRLRGRHRRRPRAGAGQAGGLSGAGIEGFSLSGYQRAGERSLRPSRAAPPVARPPLRTRLRPPCGRRMPGVSALGEPCDPTSREVLQDADITFTRSRRGRERICTGYNGAGATRNPFPAALVAAIGGWSLARSRPLPAAAKSQSATNIAADW